MENHIDFDQCIVQTVSSLTNVDHNSPHVTTYIVPQNHDIENSFLTPNVLSSLLFCNSNVNFNFKKIHDF